LLAVIVLPFAGAVVTFNYEFDFDVHWHLASGEWMLQHRAVLDHDPFSIDPPPRWLNTHWLFQVLLAALHGVAGWSSLTVLKSALAAAAMFAFAWALRRRVPAGWVILCGLVMLEVMQARVRVRPEAFSLTFLTLTILLVENVRLGGSPKRLWWLVPIMLVWANMHGLFMLGMAAVVSAIVGALVDRRFRKGVATGPLLTPYALAPVLAAAVACLVTPWPIDSFTNPFVLARRISGKEFYYTYVVSELQPTYEVLRVHPEGIAIAVAATAALVVNFRAVPVAHVGWLAAFIVLGLLARRNVALMGPVCGYLLAAHGAGVIERVAARFPRLRRVGPFAAGVAAALALAMSAAYATEWAYAVRGWPHRFGAGLLPYNYPLDAARWLEELPAKGDVLCENFGDAGVFIYYSGPRARPLRRIFIDGRNEFHSTERFVRQQTIRTEMRTRYGASKVELPPTVRFIFVRHNSVDQISSLSQNPDRYRLIRVCAAGALFARMDWIGPEAPEDNLPDGPNLDDYDRPLEPDGSVRGQPESRWRWFSQNPPAMAYRIGSICAALGRRDWDLTGPADPRRARCLLLGLRYLSAADMQGLVPRQIVTGSLAMAHEQRAFQSSPPPAGAPVDVNLARALLLFERLEPGGLDDLNMQRFAAERVRALLLDRQIDAASDVMQAILKSLPPKLQVNPASDLIELRDEIDKRLAESRKLANERVDRQIHELTFVDQATELTARDIGLIDRAIATLRAAPADDARGRLMLGDLLLRRGRSAQARQVFAEVKLDAKEAWRLDLRSALCDWAEGKLFVAMEALNRMDKASNWSYAPVVRYYLEELRKQVGVGD
jgi:hypothetical protein